MASSPITESQRAGEDNLISLLLDAQDEGPGVITDQLRDDALTVLLAGHDTIATALVWTWILLAGRPDIEQGIEDEVDATLGTRRRDRGRRAAAGVDAACLERVAAVAAAGVDCGADSGRRSRAWRRPNPGGRDRARQPVPDASRRQIFFRAAGVRSGPVARRTSAAEDGVHPVRRRAAGVHRRRVCVDGGRAAARDVCAAMAPASSRRRALHFGRIRRSRCGRHRVAGACTRAHLGCNAGRFERRRPV